MSPIRELIFAHILRHNLLVEALECSYTEPNSVIGDLCQQFYNRNEHSYRKWVHKWIQRHLKAWVKKNRHKVDVKITLPVISDVKPLNRQQPTVDSVELPTINESSFEAVEEVSVVCESISSDGQACDDLSPYSSMPDDFMENMACLEAIEESFNYDSSLLDDTLPDSLLIPVVTPARQPSDAADVPHTFQINISDEEWNTWLKPNRLLPGWPGWLRDKFKQNASIPCDIYFQSHRVGTNSAQVVVYSRCAAFATCVKYQSVKRYDSGRLTVQAKGTFHPSCLAKRRQSAERRREEEHEETVPNMWDVMESMVDEGASECSVQ